MTTLQDIPLRFSAARQADDGKSHKAHAASRDLMLAILADHPEILEYPRPFHLELIRETAVRCSNVGPLDKAIDLYRTLAAASNEAKDHFKLSEVLARGDHLDESVAALGMATALDAERYDTSANRETMRLAEARTSRPKTRIGRYPETKAFLGDLESLIRDHVAVNLRSVEGFIKDETTFFTMGSCFARNLSRGLKHQGYASHHMEIAEHINTTFANRVFVDWMKGASINAGLRERIEELLPSGWSKENMLYLLKTSDVFILTLGVAPAFFDRSNGEFVLPRPSALNSRVLAERFLFRTTTVEENVANVRHLIGFIREIAPSMKIVVTVSPVPMLASFEMESAVQADCLSKSTMRLVAHEVVNNCGIKNILYWPSFEIFRWAGSQASAYYAADDGAAWHVSEDKVAGTVDAFVKMFAL